VPQTRASASTPVRRRVDGELTRRKVLDAAVQSIMESGYYHTSSNEIARRAGVTWGTLQHQFGSREGLLLAVLEDGWQDLQEAVATAVIGGETLEDRLGAVLKVLTEHYGVPPQLAQIQILLDLTQNPTTSDETRQAALAHGRSLAQAWKPLFACALGEAAKEDDLVVFAFKTLRGYLVGELIATRVTPSRGQARQHELLVQGVAAAVRAEAKARHIRID
jgi:AcrR family transcriptional regulator